MRSAAFRSHRLTGRVLGVLLTVLLAGGVPAAEPAGAGPESTDILTPLDVAALRNVGDVAVSPSGARIAYTVSVPRRPGLDDDGAPWVELWVLDRDGEAPRPFVTGQVNVADISWTPDGRHIAFTAKRGDDKFRRLYWIPADGGEARVAAALGTDIAGYSVAADGERVVLMAAEPEPESVRKLRDKGFKQQVYEEDARPVRLWLGRAFAKGTNAWRRIPVEGSVRRVVWSPVADRLAVAVTPTPLVDDGLIRQQVRVVDLDGGLVGEVVREGKLGAFEWSPDGRRLALIAAEDRHDPDAGRLYVASGDGGPVRDLLPGFEGKVMHLGWAGDGALIVAAARGVESVVGTVSVDADSAAGLRSWGGMGQPIVTGLSVAPGGGAVVLAGHGERHPAEVFVWTSGEAAPRRRTDLNPRLAQVRWARQEVVRHAARDGLELEGILIRPLDEEPGRRYPLILAVHGGPESHVSHGWMTGYSLPGQVAAARGFAVFHPNYRGSTGRGVAFSKLGQGDAAGREFDDLVDAVDHLVASGLVDRDRVGVTGGSYGGYATAWCSTRFSERFAAGVMFVGISDKVSKVGTTDIPDEEYLVHARKRPWEEWQFLLERSPVYHAGNSRTPLLILHGTDDPRVNVGQSREMYRHLKLRSAAPVRLVLYPGEVHGNRKAAARYDYHLRMLRWFGHYLQGPGGAVPPMDIEVPFPPAEE